jgi:hypothetical protein
MSDGELDIPVATRESMQTMAGREFWILEDGARIIAEAEPQSVRERGLHE